MKSTLCALAVIAVVVGFVEAKPGKTTNSTASGGRVALIDMAHVIKNSDEFKTRRNALKIEIEKSDRRSLPPDQALQNEALILKEVYWKTQHVVSKIAKDRGISIVLRFSRRQISDAKAPKEILETTNQQVVFSENNHDITDAVLQELNRRYKSPEIPRLLK